ncbi:MAG: 2-oxoisovalerate dehydrogenase [Acidobacteriota bacterium]|nr:2-oxoisovalerate dehydrogenase [Acidobacteriota bacterium]
MNELIFLVEDAPEGGYTARALGVSIFTEADDLNGLRERVRDAVRCHFDDWHGQCEIRLHFIN